ncbi:GNAT family N-acetyltransferase [Acinetobacter sp. ANC 5378]|uniref:GNAT family N-acetyltransferase n=1 Tax=Acinetobacter sp. ANC 5378 TaxID=2731249 RepID=UPI0014904541|nr:GNAT family N-acetyltransferase [Acinetobacter sp. ANC 5378]NNG82038.1 GNAT family N-acetyltransferase [Acinetobacter sp. ANC 5378]
MRLRVATLPDVPAMVALGGEFIKEAPNYKNRPYLAENAAKHFISLIKGGGVVLLVEHDNQIAGGFVGRIGGDWFNNTKIAFDDCLYVKPEFRKSRAAYMLIQAFIRWAQLMGASRIQCGTTTGVESAACIRLYKHFGFTEYGTVLDKELKA